MNATGILAPGASVGTFLASSAIFTDATFAVEVDRTTTTADKMIVPGLVDLLGTSLTLIVTSVAVGGYDAWVAQITNGKTLRSQDADDDGFSNLQEFLFGTSPMAGNGSLKSPVAP